MKLSVLANLYGSKPLDEALKIISSLGVHSVEIGAGGYPGKDHCDPEKLLNDEKALEEFKATFKKYDVEIISCMGTANKTDPNGFKIVDINQTSYCPLAKKIRTELKKKNISNVKVCFSTETPINTQIPLASQIYVVASSSFVIVKAAIEMLLSK